MPDRIALQLYTVRELADKDYAGTVRRIAEAGYKAVETAGFPGTTPEAADRLFKELGLTVCSAHVPLPLGANKQKVLETLEALGKPTLICTEIRPDDVQTMDTVKSLCDRLNQGYAVAKENGLRYGIHNHWWEFGTLNNRLVHDIMVELLDPGILFELDTYWIKVGGVDPVKIIRELGKRAAYLHIKDGPGVRDQPHTAVGEGVIDIPAIVKAGGKNVEWLVVELDACATDIMAAVKKSYDYLHKLEANQ